MSKLKVNSAEPRAQLITGILCKAKGLPEWNFTEKELEKMPIGALEQLFHSVSKEAQQ